MTVMIATGAVLLILAAMGAGLLFLRSARLSPSSILLPFRTSGRRLVEAQSGELLQYRLFEPGNVRGGSTVPLVVVLHTAYESGGNNLSQLTTTIRLLTSRAYQRIQGAYVVVPQSPRGLQWIDAPPQPVPLVNYDMAAVDVSWRERAIAQLVRELVAAYPIDPRRVSITGESMGATGTWSMLYRFPDVFSAAVTLSGRSDPAIAPEIAHVPVRSFHGKHDSISLLSNSTTMTDALRRAGADAELTILDAGHGIADLTWTRDLYRWMTGQRRPTPG